MTVAGTLSWVDWVLLAVLLASVVVGIWRGLVFELLSLVGWLVAYVLAQLYSPQVALWLSGLLPSQGAATTTPSVAPWLAQSAPHQAAAFAVTFIAALVTWTLLARLVRLVIHATPLTLVDRTLGAGFGLLRGAVLLLVVATVVALTPARGSAPWQASQGAVWLGLVLQGLKPVLPVDVARQLPA